MKNEAKPDNSKEFFSARKPESNVLAFTFNRTVEKDVSHPWRYFVAAGESLAKLQEFKADALRYDADVKAVADSVGADGVSYGRFVFKNAEVDVELPSIQLRIKSSPFGFVSNISTPENFFPDANNGWFPEVKRRMAEINALPAGEAEAARAKLAQDFQADSFDGRYFHFNNWNTKVETVQPSSEKRERLKSNPVFIRTFGTEFSPDPNLDEGFRLQQKMQELANNTNPNWRFGQWLEQFKLDIAYYPSSPNRDEKNVEVEIIGKEWIIKVPVATEGIYGTDGKGGTKSGEKEGWVLPPGATPIKVSEYFAKLEDNASLRALPKPPGVKKRS